MVLPVVPGVGKLTAQTVAPPAARPVRQPRQPAPEQVDVLRASTWSADQPATPATIRWDSRGLEIEASNSSLNQILHQVATDTGAKLEGLAQDQRVFGTYGPGPGSDVLWKLLDGSGYNVLIIGGRGRDAPLKILLSARPPADHRLSANRQSRTAPQQPEPTPRPEYPAERPATQPAQNPFANGEAPRDPMQFMQEILDRQHHIDQQLQQDQKNDLHRPSVP